MDLTVLMLVDQLNIGGTETHVLSLAKELNRTGVRVILGTAGGILLDAMQAGMAEAVRLPFKSDDPVHEEYQQLLEKAKELVETRAVDLIHAHSIAALKVAVQVSQETLVPTVATIHGKFYPPRKLRGLLDRCPKVIAVSSPAVTWLSKTIDYPLGQIALIPNGIDTGHFTPGSKTNAFREQLQLGPEDKLVVLVSRLAWEKTRVVEAAIEAAASLQSEFPLRLAIVGGGAHKPLVHATAELANERLGKEVISLVGHRTDPLECYQAADAVIGTARVALEALSCGKPLIAAGNVSYVGILEPENLAKAWAVYFGDHQWAQPLTVPKLTDDLRRVLLQQEEFEKNAGKLRDWVIANFEIKDVAQKTKDFYRGVLAGEELAPEMLAAPDVQDKKRSAKLVLSKLPEEKPLISAAIPAYNRGHYLKECLDSLAKQSYRPLEIVVVNDGSDDNTGEAAQAWWEGLESRQGLSFVYLELPHNTGYASAQSIAYQISSGEYIANQDSDDVSHPQRLEKQLSFLLAYPDYSLAGSNFAVFEEDITKAKRSYMVRYGFENILERYHNGGHAICFGTLLFRRAVFERIGGLTSFLKGAEDYEWITRALNQGFYVDNLKEQLYYYRAHPGQLSRLVKSARGPLKPWQYTLDLEMVE